MSAGVLAMGHQLEMVTEAVRMPRGLPRGNLAPSGSRESELEERRPLVKHGV